MHNSEIPSFRNKFKPIITSDLGSFFPLRKYFSVAGTTFSIEKNNIQYNDTVNDLDFDPVNNLCMTVYPFVNKRKRYPKTKIKSILGSSAFFSH